MAKQPSRLRQWLLALPGLLLFAALPWLPADQTYLQQHAEQQALQKFIDPWVQYTQFFRHLRHISEVADVPLLEAFQSSPGTPQETLPWIAWASATPAVVIVRCNQQRCRPQYYQRLRKSGLFYPIPPQRSSTPSGKKTPKAPDVGLIPSHRLDLTFQRGPQDTLVAHATLSQVPRSMVPAKDITPSSLLLYRASTQALPVVWRTQRQIPLIRWYAIVPPLAAIYLVLLTRRILLSLFLSVFVGVTLLHHLNPWLGLYHTGRTYLWEKAICQEFSLNIILFVLCLIGMINVCTRNGGVMGLIQGLVRYARTARSSRLITATLGLVIFFDDYANTITVGNTMRPLTDRFRVSREKLAYLIDSTAAPIAGLALLSTWIGYEVGILQDLSNNLHLQVSGYQLFLQSLPYRFYCWMTLLFLFLGIGLNRDFGPMWEAERRAAEEGKLVRDQAQPMLDMNMEKIQPSDRIAYRSYNALLPLAFVFFSIFVGLLYSGGYFHGQPLRAALAQANGSKVFLWSAIGGSVLAILLSVTQRLLTLFEALEAWVLGARALVLAVGILLFAWSMGALSQDLGSAHYLIALVHQHLHSAWVPLLIFLMAAGVALATGTSWGTMSILLPTAVPLAYNIGGMPLLILSIGAVLDGAIFGDHCSPLSDTTLFSSAAASCDHVDHVKTQLPYAFTVMIVAALCGYLAVAYGMSPFLSPGLALCAFVAIFYTAGRPTPSSIPSLHPDRSSP